MTRRRAAAAVIAAGVAIVTVISLTGCGAFVQAGFSRSDAQADATSWTSSAVHAVGTIESGGASNTKASGFISCRSDTSFFTTTYEWRTITDVAVPLARQAGATKAVTDAFANANWTSSVKRGLTSLVGPTGAKHKGLITIQTAGPSQISIAVISPCYK